jgi:hypothetical protein
MPTKMRNVFIFIGVLLLLAFPVLADRTIVRTGPNSFTAQQDVELGRALITEAENTLDFSNDTYAHGYINALGNHVATHAPGYKYPWEFRIFNDPSINSFALPGGVIYVSSGVVEAAQTEPQLAGFLAHQIAHVVLRHGTQQVSRSYSNRVRANVADAVNRLDLRVDNGSVLFINTPAAEAQADVIATQMLYDGQFDPRQMPAFLQRLANQNRSAEFLRDHPGIGAGTARVRRELQNIGPLAANLRGDSPDLHQTQRNLRTEATTGRIYDDNRDNIRDLPSNRTLVYRGGDLAFRYPDNWRVSDDGEVIDIAPSGGKVSGSLAYGMQIAWFEPQGGRYYGGSSLVAPQGSRTGRLTLSSATDQLLAELRRTNPNIRVTRTGERWRVDGEQVLAIQLTNDSPVGGRETNWLVSVLRPDGWVVYFIGVAPEREFSRYKPAFENIVNSVAFQY